MSQTQTASKPLAAAAEPAMFVRMTSVTRMTGLGRSTIYRLISEKKFPCPVKLSGRAVGWRRIDLDRWSEARPTAAMH
ncbi:MAG: AlpA family phage regulatory protein [Comamonadaceae bacterium]|nr:MAG: AlpA family phage regulatory protein [Comamonadaceae bacterium]